VTFTEDDLDRLADYVAGVLDPAEEAAVAALVRDDPAWAAAYDGLVTADAQLATQLRAEVEDAMPADVVSRISSALDAAGRDKTRAVTRTPWWENLRQGLRRHAALAALGAAAAALVAVVGGGMVSGALPSQKSDSAADSAAGREMTADSPAGGSSTVASGSALAALPDDPDFSSMAVISTDADYSWATLPLAARTAYSSAKTSARQVPVPAALSALSAPAALRACLEAVAAAVGGTPVSAEFAAYNGVPALVVILTRTGATSVAAVGPACGPGHADVQAVRSIA
jgi:hypothetical protein